MIIAIKRSRQATRMIKNKSRREHKRYHLELANKLRNNAEEFKRKYEEQTKSAYDAELINKAMYDEAQKEIDRVYHDHLAEAIAEENSKCMDDRRH